MKRCLGEEDSEGAEEFIRRYDISPEGNYEGKSIPNLIRLVSDGDLKHALPPRQGTVEKSRKRLAEFRRKRVHPGVDDKVLTSWNALAVAALAKASRAFDSVDYLHMAEACLDFVMKVLLKDGQLYARYRDGDVSYEGYLDDYAFLIWALIEMNQTTLDRKYTAEAEKLARKMVRVFWDSHSRGFFMTGVASEELIVRPKETYDGAVPSGNSVAVMDLLRLSRILEAEDLEKVAKSALDAMLPQIQKNPVVYGHLLSALDYFAGGAQDITIYGAKDDPKVEAMVRYILTLYLPNAQIALGEAYPAMSREPELVICEKEMCSAPIHSIDDLQIALMRAANAEMTSRPAEKHW